MAKNRNNLEYAKNKIYETHNGTIDLLEFNGNNKNGTFSCNICGHIWSTVRADKVINKTGCPNCAKNKDRLSFDYVSNFIKENNCELISDNYVDAKNKLTVKFECGHIGEVIWNEFQQGKRCTICGIKARSSKHRTKEEDIIQFLKNNNFTFVDFPDGYKSQRKSFVRYSCSKGHITTRAVMNIYKYTTCKTCEFIDLATLHTGSSNIWWQGGISEVTTLIRNNIKEWKKASMKECDYKCVITGDKFDAIHHLYSFNLILKEAFKNLDLDIDFKKSYDEEMQNKIICEVNNIHKNYPFGVCLRKDIHDLFHKTYGIKKNTPDQWYDFVEKIRNGEILIEKEGS